MDVIEIKLAVRDICISLRYYSLLRTTAQHTFSSLETCRVNAFYLQTTKKQKLLFFTRIVAI